MEICQVCGGEDLLRVGLCPPCGGGSSAPADILVFVCPAPDPEDREVARQAVTAFLQGHYDAADVTDVVEGRRALMAVTAISVATVLDQLRQRGIPVRTLPRRGLWIPLPPPFWIALLAIVGTGWMAGSLGVPGVRWLSLLAVAAVLTAIQLRQRSPLLPPPRPLPELPETADRKVVQALEELAEPSVRGLLVDVVRGARELRASRGGDGRLDAQLTRVVAAACDAALEMGDLNLDLERLARRRAGFTGLPTRWLNGLERCESSRDALVNHLRELVTALARVDGLAAGSAAAATARLSEVAQVMEDGMRELATTRQEVGELLTRSA